ncbi:MAG TPA: SGNH/GDSL hydrolase family protein, partial [Chloroflexia bacterium]|nr:SGNH/GDSL hydrolase family protein [Chloroflexia bacterium]
LPDLSLVLSPTLAPGGAPELRARVVAWNRAIESTAAPYGDRVLLVDLFPESDTITRDSTVISGDNWHPSTAGYKVIGDFVYAQMQAAGLIGP